MNRMALWLLKYGAAVIVIADSTAELVRLTYRTVINDPIYYRRQRTRKNRTRISKRRGS